MGKKRISQNKSNAASVPPQDMEPSSPDGFGEIISLIELARRKTFKAVNHELISLYWEIGKYVSEKVRKQGWGKSIVTELSQTIQSHYVGIRGFSTPNIWRMKQFYETYQGHEKLAAVLREITWSNHVRIFK